MKLAEWLSSGKLKACRRGIRFAYGKTYKQALETCNRGDFYCFVLDKIYEEKGGPLVEVWDREWWKVFLYGLFGDTFLEYREMFYIFRGWDSYHRSDGSYQYFYDWYGATETVKKLMPEKIGELTSRITFGL